MNKSKETWIRFEKCWILINLCKFEVEVHIFYKKKWSKTDQVEVEVHIFYKKNGQKLAIVGQFLRYQKTRTYFSR